MSAAAELAVLAQLDELGRAWLAHAWLSGPALALAVTALAYRLGLVRRALARFDDRGEGEHLDGRTALPAVVERLQAQPADVAGWLAVGHAEVSKKGAKPVRPVVTLEAPVQLRLGDGSALVLPKGAAVTMDTLTFGDESKLRLVSVGSTGRRYEVRLAEGASVWALASLAPPPPDAGPLRTSAGRALVSGAAVTLAAKAPEAPECSFAGPYALVWLAAVGSVWCAAAEGWEVPAMVLEGLWGALALRSIAATRGLSTRLAGRS